MYSSEEILKLAEKYTDYTSGNLSKLIKQKSLSLHEKDAVDEAVKLMKEAGFDEVRVDGLGNAIGRIGSGKKVIAIDGHIDTVDIGNLENWDFDPLGGEIKEGFVHGRGSVDQKGGIASFITAGKILKDIGYDTDTTIYFTASVIEEDCDGLCWKYIVEEEKIKPEFVIITEPTNLGIYRGHRGRMEMEVSFFGKSSHGSAPDRGINAIYMASRTALEIEKLNVKLLTDPFLGKGSITTTEIKSTSPSLCAVSDFCKIHLDRRLTGGEDKILAMNQIDELVKQMKAKVELLEFSEKSYTGLEYGMKKYYPTWQIDEKSQLIQNGAEVYRKLFKDDPVIDKWSFSTNGVTINGYYKIPVIGFGPGNEIYAHAPNEKVPVEHLTKAAAFYASLLVNS